MLGREAVVDRDDFEAAGGRDEPADRVGRVEAADDPAAAVEVHDGAFGLAHVLIAARPDGSRARRDLDVFDVRDGQRAAEDAGFGVDLGSRAIQRQVGEVGSWEGVEQSQRHLHLGVQALAVHDDRPTGDDPLDRFGQRAERADDGAHQAFGGGGSVGHGGSSGSAASTIRGRPATGRDRMRSTIAIVGDLSRSTPASERTSSAK